ncbi:MAG TPA: DUF4097 family beta strand repeat-containing protein, partial [Bacillota bacterium]|nr:DUF4097 family beta strand repeat-containing protein [Bacillota bacterium]
MSKLAKALLVVGVIWLVLVAAIGVGGFTLFGLRQAVDFLPGFIGVRESAQRTDNTTYIAETVTSIDIISRNGTVDVSSGKGEDVVILARYTVWDNSQSAAQTRLDRLSTAVTETEGKLRVEAIFPSMTVSNESVSYEVIVPEGIDVNVKTSNGTITVVGIEGVLNLETSNGTIEITAAGGPSQVTARTSNGRIILEGGPRVTSGTYDLRTSNGAIFITLPEELGVEVDLSTSNGNITLGSGKWLLEGGQISSRAAKATRGDGALKIRAVTSNGNIVITN